VYYDGSIYVSHGNRGGHGSIAEALTYFDRYDIATATWTALPNALYPRDHTGGAVVNGTWLCVAAGRDGGGVSGFFNAVVLQTECYDLLSGANGVWIVEVKALALPGRMWMCLMERLGQHGMLWLGLAMVRAWRSLAIAVLVVLVHNKFMLRLEEQLKEEALTLPLLKLSFQME
jgi:hypothetical protein